MLRTVIENAMPAHQVADAVHDAIRTQQLYILTHESSFGPIEARMRNILDGTNPGPPLGSPETLQK